MLADTLVLEYDVELAEERARMKAEHEARLWEEKKQIARDLKKHGVPIETIAKNFGLSISEVEKL